MAPNNDVCPLCCEELDMSDRQFFPCKCGYQVCMWCWHRIRESESGLCPACRTPYGDDPHEFSAVDMEDVVKANKEKAAAEKREREKMRREKQLGDGASVGSAGSFGAEVREDVPIRCMDVPKDRNQLANMRVIRRNLVYAVGLPPSIATEETLRKPEYFGQYGKISKIVLNRNHNGNGDPRRASASAYVTFAHKEDTLACILALDGFYLDGRNIRASYGTSKYCSAFIKSVRCNNPDCTYLHYMGDSEDTFTKQEIQAGYVTSGRDVLARQQQQLAKEQSATGMTRRRVGGGGPSGSGRGCSNPVFPPPCFDEPAKPPPSPSPGMSIPPSRSSSMTIPPAGGFPAVSAPAPAKQRSSSFSGPTPSEKSRPRGATPLQSPVAAKAPAKKSATTAAAVVAGNPPSATPSPGVTLTALTPLKRSSSLPAHPKEKTPTVQQQKKHSPVEGSPTPPQEEQQNRILMHEVNLARQRERAAPIGSQKQHSYQAAPGGFIGGSVLMGPGTVGGSVPSYGLGGLPGMNPGLIGGHIGRKDDDRPLMGFNSGGQLFQESKQEDPFRQNDEWDRFGGGGSGLFGNSNSFGFNSGGGGIWGDSGHAPPNASLPSLSQNNNFLGGMQDQRLAPVRPAAIGDHYSNPPGTIGSGHMINKNPFSRNEDSGSSALASMLGIDLPTGSGSLRERETFGNGNNMASMGGNYSAFNQTNLPNSNPMPSHNPPSTLWPTPPPPQPRPTTGPIGSSSSNPISRPQNFISQPPTAPNSDIALLQSLLPGVHITSGNAHQPAAPSQNWNHVHGAPQPYHHQAPPPNQNTWGLFSQSDGNRTERNQGMNSNQASIW